MTEPCTSVPILVAVAGTEFSQHDAFRFRCSRGNREERNEIVLANFLASCHFYSIQELMISKTNRTGDNLSRRHRQIMDELFELGEASAEEIRARIPNPPSNSAVRATLKIMEDRGLVVRKEKGFHYVYSPGVAKEASQTSAVQRLLRRFFNNSAEQAMVALLGATKEGLSAEELDRIRGMIENAKRRSR